MIFARLAVLCTKRRIDFPSGEILLDPRPRSSEFQSIANHQGGVDVLFKIGGLRRSPPCGESWTENSDTLPARPAHTFLSKELPTTNKNVSFISNFSGKNRISR